MKCENLWQMPGVGEGGEPISLQNEMLGPIIQRFLDILYRRGILPKEERIEESIL